MKLYGAIKCWLIYRLYAALISQVLKNDQSFWFFLSNKKKHFCKIKIFELLSARFFNFSL